MKTRWQFRFEAWDVHFGRDRRFSLSRTPASETDADLAVTGEVLVLLEKGHQRDRHDSPDEAGKFQITVRGTPEDTDDLAHYLADEVKERLSFPAGRIQLFGGMVFAERLPETPEEEAAIGEGRHYVRMQMVEVPLPADVYADKFPALAFPAAHSALLRQFNTAKGVAAPVERFLAFFKVLESAYVLKGGSTVDMLRKSDELYSIAADTLAPTDPAGGMPTRQAYEDAIQTMVRIRNNCAHLRSTFGYRPDDPRVATEVTPYLDVVEDFARGCIKARIKEADPK